MRKIIYPSLLGLAFTILSLYAPSATGGDLKPYKGWLIFPPTPGTDGASYSVRHDNIGGVGLRRSVDVGMLPPVFNSDGTMTLTLFEEGVITYPNGDTITDKATVVLVASLDMRFLYGGSCEAKITGGTGRFQGATGWGRMIVEGSFVPPYDMASGIPFRMDFEGMISTVGSLQRRK